MLKKCFRISLREHFFILVVETTQVMSRILQTGSMLLLGFLILANTPSVTAQSSREDLTTYVDPLIGTAHCLWFHFAPGSLDRTSVVLGKSVSLRVGLVGRRIIEKKKKKINYL